MAKRIRNPAGYKRKELNSTINDMFVRIVKMTFQENRIEEFSVLFDERKDKIRNFPGCQYLQLLQDKNDPRIFMTYSIWNSDTDLELYRNSELFADTWKKTKACFSEKAQAWSMQSNFNSNEQD